MSEFIKLETKMTAVICKEISSFV